MSARVKYLRPAPGVSMQSEEDKNKMQFDPARTSTLHAAMDRIIPADDFPSASELGVAEFIRRILETEADLPADAFLRGLDSLSAEAISLFSQPFAALTPARQDDVLQRVENGSVQSQWLNDPREFFRMLVNLTSEGYYSDPGNGGNRDQIAWKMIGYDPRGNG
jgi:hypothetical protein